MSGRIGAELTLVAHASIRCGLPGPPIGPANHGEWYEKAEQLPETRMAGWFGAILGSGSNDKDVQLFFYEDDPLKPQMKLVMDQSDIVRLSKALDKFIKDRGLT